MVFGKCYSRIKLVHPYRPLLISDHGFQIKVQDLMQMSEYSSAPQDSEQTALYLNMPFSEACFCIDSLHITKDGGQLAAIVRHQDKPFGDLKYYFVLFDLGNYQCLGYMEVPKVVDRWDQASPLGERI